MNTTAAWMVRLEGHPFDLDYLAGQMNQGDDRVERDGEDYVLWAAGFNALTDAEAVLKRAEEIIARANGAAKMLSGSFHTVRVDLVTRVHGDGRRQRFMFASGGATVRARASAVCHVTGGVVDNTPAPPTDLERWTALAERNSRVQDVLRLVETQGLDWVNLYRIYEIVREDVGGRFAGKLQIINNGWATRDEIELFVKTSCNPDAVGDEARHGVATEDAPADPMPLSQAENLIRHIVYQWVASKL